jgi:hypothetical protein
MLTEFFPVSNEEASEDSELSDGAEDPQEENKESSYEDIRSEVRSELLSGLDEDLEDVDLDLKVARLKRLAKEKRAGGTGPAVRRLSND